MLSWEKPLVKHMAPGSIFHHTSFQSILLSIYIIKIPIRLILLLSSLSDLTLASGREGIDNPFIALVARFLFVCVGTRWLARGLLLDWYLGSQKLREILTLLYRTTLSSSRENQRSAQEVARRISCTVAGEIYAESRHTKYPSQTLIPRITLFAICLSFSSPPLHPCRFMHPFFPSTFFPYVSFFEFPCAFYLLASLLAKNLLIWIHLKCSTWIIFNPYALMLKPQLA